MNCPICWDTRLTLFYQWPDFAVETCNGCGFRFIDTTAPTYPTDAQYRFDEPEIGPIRPERPHIQRRVRDILRFYSPPGQAVDIGCGKGEVTLALHQVGFNASGIDMKSPLMTHLQQAHPHLRWRSANTNDLAGMSERYDVLTLYHVLEHVADPRAVLASVKALANPGALIVIEVPNVAGWKARLQGRRWVYYKVDHVNYFRPRDIQRLATDLDLSLLAIRGYQHFSYPQHVLWKDLIKGALALVGFQDVSSVFLRVN